MNRMTTIPGMIRDWKPSNPPSGSVPAVSGLLLRDVLDETIRSWARKEPHQSLWVAEELAEQHDIIDRRPTEARRRTPVPRLETEDRRAVLEAARSVAVRRASRKLGINSSDLSYLAFALWGRSFIAERNSRADAMAPKRKGARSVSAYRGHATRQLLAELEPHTQPYSVANTG